MLHPFSPLFLPTLGLPELVLVLAIVLLIFGPSKLPQVAKALGESIKQFKQASTPSASTPPPEDVTPSVSSTNTSKTDLS